MKRLEVSLPELTMVVELVPLGAPSTVMVYLGGQATRLQFQNVYEVSKFLRSLRYTVSTINEWLEEVS